MKFNILDAQMDYKDLVFLQSLVPLSWGVFHTPLKTINILDYYG